MESLISSLVGALVLAVAQWVYYASQRFLDRRRRRLGRQLTVSVLVDNYRRGRRRTCFWPDLFSANADLRQRGRIRLLSIPNELRRERNPAMKLFTSDTSDVIVANWDVINCDPVFGADRSYAFMQHYRPDMLEWLKRGGVLVLESQGASWGGLQAPYDAVASMFANSSVRVRSDMWSLGASAVVNELHKDSPLVAGLTDEDLKLRPGGLWARKGWFPKRLLQSDIYSLRFVRRHQQHLYRGWFESWSDDWTPVLLADNPATPDPNGGAPGAQRAVALVREVGGHGGSDQLAETGFVVLTTMFLASSELTALISSVLTLTDRVNRS